MRKEVGLGREKAAGGGLPVQLEILDLEVDADGGDKGGGEGVVGVAEEQAGLAHTWSHGWTYRAPT